MNYAKSQLFVSEMTVTVVCFWLCHWITSASDTSDGTIISTSGFSLQVYQVTKSEKDFTATDTKGYETHT